MTPTSVVRAAVATERRDLADLLAALPTEQWDADSLCGGWRVRDVVAHITTPFRYSVPRFVLEMARSLGRFNHMSDRCARRDGSALSAAELVQSLRENVDHPWKPPGGGFEGALSHDVIHGLDVTVALGLGRNVPKDRLRIVLDGLRPKNVAFFGVDLDGIELRADDLDWSHGSGQVVTGSAQNLLLVLCGRTLPPGHVHGTASARFTRA